MSCQNEPFTYTVSVPSGKTGRRLDKLLAEALPELSRSRLKALIDGGSVHLAGGAVMSSPSRKVREGEAFIVIVPPAVAARPVAQDIPLDIVYEDEDVIVVDKPVGLVVHPAPGNPDRTLVNALLGHAAKSKGIKGGLSGIGGVERPGIVHRLDKGTSGLMVVAKNDLSHRSLSRQFSDRTVERAYKALVWGVPVPSKGEIGGSIGRNPNNRKKMAVVRHGGKPALTRYKVLEIFGSAISLIECRLATGRTHQIRVHMANIGHPVIGDPLYGRAGASRMKGLDAGTVELINSLGHQALHAYLLGYKPLRDQPEVLFKSNLPSDFNELLARLQSK